MIRFPFAPLEAVLLRETGERNVSQWARRLGVVERSTVLRWERQGLTLNRADRAAIRLGYHPVVLWGEAWLEGAVPTPKRRRASPSRSRPPVKRRAPSRPVEPARGWPAVMNQGLTAQFLGVRRQRLWRHVANGTFPVEPMPVGGHLLFRRVELEAEFGSPPCVVKWAALRGPDGAVARRRRVRAGSAPFLERSGEQALACKVLGRGLRSAAHRPEVTAGPEQWRACGASSRG